MNSSNDLPILSPQILDTWDRCQRRFAFERDWETRAISGLGLCYRALEGALSEPIPEEAAKSIALKLASQMELRVSSPSTYDAIEHYGGLAGIIAVFIRGKLGILMRSPVNQQDGYEWHPATFEDSSGLRHRFALVDHWDDDRLSAEAHSWRTIGELAATGRPLTLHAIVIGVHRAGRRHSPWTRGYLHPLSKKLRFSKQTRNQGSHREFGGQWTIMWRDNYPNCSTESWLLQMQEDDVIRDLVISRPVKLDPSDRRLLAAKREIVQIQQQMEKATVNEPMRRSSCDETGRGPCPFAACCYSSMEITPGALPHLYVRKK